MVDNDNIISSCSPEPGQYVIMHVYKYILHIFSVSLTRAQLFCTIIRCWRCTKTRWSAHCRSCRFMSGGLYSRVTRRPSSTSHLCLKAQPGECSSYCFQAVNIMVETVIIHLYSCVFVFQLSQQMSAEGRTLQRSAGAVPESYRNLRTGNRRVTHLHTARQDEDSVPLIDITVCKC